MQTNSKPRRAPDKGSISYPRPVTDFSPSSSLPGFDRLEKHDPKLASHGKSLWRSWICNAIDLSADWWLLEVSSWSLGALSMFYVVGILAAFNGKPLPEDLPLGFTLNAYISIFSAIAKLALAVPLQECLGAQKHRWFSTEKAERPLSDYELFSDAPYSPFSALRLSMRTRLRSSASLGALIVLLSLGLDPFFQQLLSLPKRPSLVDRSTIPRVVNFRSDLVEQERGIVVVGSDLTLTSAVRPFFIQADNANPGISVHCPAGECMWPTFDTLGVCSECVSIAELLDFGCMPDTGEWKPTAGSDGELLPEVSNGTSCGWFFNITSDERVLMNGYGLAPGLEDSTIEDSLIMRLLNLRDPLTNKLYWNTKLHFPEVSAPIANFAVVASQNQTTVHLNQTPEAYECVMLWCVKTISASYTGGELTEQVIKTAVNSTVIPDFLEVTTLPDGTLDYHFTTNITIDPEGHSETFMVGNTSALSARFVMDLWAPSYLTQTNLSSSFSLRFSTALNPETVTGSISSWASIGDIPTIVHNISTAMTNALRNTHQNAEAVLGSGIYEVFVEVRWAWFTFPLAILLFTLVFLVITIYQTSGRPVWKGSSLTTLTHGLSNESRRIFADVATMRETRRRAEKLLVRMNMEKEGATLDIEEQPKGDYSMCE